MKTINKRLVICGSMSFYEQMEYLKTILMEQNILCITPSTDGEYEKYYSNQSFDDYKRVISYNYLKKIKQLETQGILIVNLDKHNINNYIGPNTFAEIVIAFNNRKKIYLLNGIPDVYYDELVSWNAKAFNGNIGNLIEEIKNDFYKETLQLELFDEN
jgi:hypothetical protein